ncbi:unnamed protein product, partial [Laminaria digitata]
MEEGMETAKESAAPMTLAPAGPAFAGGIPDALSEIARQASRAVAVPHETKSASAAKSSPSTFFIPTTDAEMVDISTSSESPSPSSSASSQEQIQAPRGASADGR